jgi:hypothetical protein
MRQMLYSILIEFSISMRLIRLIKICLYFLYVCIFYLLFCVGVKLGLSH